MSSSEESSGDLPGEVETTTTTSSSLFNSPVMVDSPSGSTAQHSKRAREDDQVQPNSSRKRAEVLYQRRKTVLQLYQQHSEQSSSSQKILARLKHLYKYKLLPLEQKYSSFGIPEEIREAEFEAKPMVLLLGPYSTGKTTFITHLLGGDFPGAHIGPEPTTDRFMALVHGTSEGVTAYNDTAVEKDDDYVKEDEDPHSWLEKEKRQLPGRVMKGNTLTVTPELPFASLANFGSAFLNHFEGSICSSPLLRNLTMIDTPGVLSGEKQRSRSYNFSETTKWFADRSDLILLLFDAHKLDLSDEFKEVVETIRPDNDDKIRCILNKADSVSREQLVRVYGSLMWSMGKLFDSPEVARVYTGSYWDEPLQHDDFQRMFESDEWLLIDELMNLPAVSAERKVNAMVKRIRMVKVHICILGYLSQQMPRLYGRQHVRQSLLKNLKQVFVNVRQKYKLSAGDMPDVKEFRKTLEQFEDFAVFPVPTKAMLDELDHLIRDEIPSIIKQSPGNKRGNHGRRGIAKNKAAKREPDDDEDSVGSEEGQVVSSFRSLEAAGMLVAAGIAVIFLVYFVFIPMFREQPRAFVEDDDKVEEEVRHEEL